MRLVIVKIEPSSKRGVFAVEAPAGSVAMLARMNRMGDGEIVFACGDAATTALQDVQMLSLWEDDGNQSQESPADWRLIGSLNYSSGGWQHLFARVAAQKTKRGVDFSSGTA